MSPGMDMLFRGLAFAGAALIVGNYYRSGSGNLFDTGGFMPALVIGVACLLIEMYLPRAEYYIESQV
jgi:hypothetical protein